MNATLKRILTVLMVMALLAGEWTVAAFAQDTPAAHPAAVPVEPTPAPTQEAPAPTAEPTPVPIVEPTPAPTQEAPAPTAEPTAEPTPAPTAEPTPEPTAEPTPAPTQEAPAPTAEPTAGPTPVPTEEAPVPTQEAPEATAEPAAEETPAPTEIVPETLPDAQLAADAFNLSSYSAADVIVTSGEVFTYNTKPQTYASVQVILDGVTPLVENVDYTLTYSNNINASSTAKLTINGIGLYSGTLFKTFTIRRAGVANLTVLNRIGACEYTGSPLQPDVVMRLGDYQLVKGKDYTMSYRNNVNLGEATATIYFTGNFQDSLQTTFAIHRCNMENVTVTGIPASYAYDRTTHAPEPVVTFKGETLVKGKDYAVYYRNNRYAGTASVEITGTANSTFYREQDYNGCFGTKIVTFEIEPVDIARVTVYNWVATPYYTGNPVYQQYLYLRDSELDYYDLVCDQDYTITYSNNVEVGMATCTIEGIGNYTGKQTYTYEIQRAPIGYAAVTLPGKLAYTGSPLTPEPVVVRSGVVLQKGVDYTVAYQNNTACGTASVVLTGIGNYTGSKTYTFVIEEVMADTINVSADCDFILPDGTAQLTAEVLPADAYNKAYTWRSSDESIATVSPDGAVTTYGKEGTVTFTAVLTANEAVQGSITLDVREAISHVELSLADVSIAVGQRVETLCPVLQPGQADASLLRWEIGDTRIASFEGGVLTGLAVGDTTITAYYKDLSATAQLHVLPYGKGVLRFALNKTELRLAVGKTQILKGTFLPKAPADKTIRWYSSDEAVATVSAKGAVRAVGKGTAVITAICSSGYAAQCTVEVYRPAAQVTVQPADGLPAAIDLYAGTDGQQPVSRTLQLTAAALPDEAQQTFTWKTGNAAVATVDENGLVTAHKVGTVKITATANDGSKKSGSCTISVRYSAGVIMATAVKLDQKTASVTYDQGDVMGNKAIELTATVTPEYAYRTDVTWQSSNAAVAQVTAVRTDENGASVATIAAVGVGTAKITAAAADGSGKSAVCTVKVSATPVSKIALNRTALTLAVAQGEEYSAVTARLTADVTPATAYDTALVWQSSDESVATVAPADELGHTVVVTAAGSGKATLTATAADGSKKKATCTVTVTAPKVQTITMTETRHTVTIDRGSSVRQTFLLGAKAGPDEAYDRTVVWKSSNEAVAVVTPTACANGLSTAKVTTLGPGSATITATAADGSGKKAVCTVTVKVVMVQKIVLTDSATGLAANKLTIHADAQNDLGTVGAQLTAAVTPNNAHQQDVLWHSNNTAVATVDQTGYITAVGGGKATITATAMDGSKKKATCAVTVQRKVDAVDITSKEDLPEEGSLLLNKGEKLTLTAVVSPAAATNTKVKWQSTNTAVATVTANGVVTTRKAGECEIVATAADGSGAQARLSLCVVQPATGVSLTVDRVMLIDTVQTPVITTLPEGAYVTQMQLVSDNPDILSVEAGGTVRAVGFGTATLTAIAQGNGTQASKSVTVSVGGPSLKISSWKITSTSLSFIVRNDSSAPIHLEPSLLVMGDTGNTHCKNRYSNDDFGWTIQPGATVLCYFVRQYDDALATYKEIWMAPEFSCNGKSYRGWFCRDTSHYDHNYHRTDVDEDWSYEWDGTPIF